MTKRIELIGENRDGEAYYSRTQRQQMKDELSLWKNHIKLIITIAPLYGKRSLEMNGYWHGYLFKEIRNGLIDKGWNSEEMTMETVKEFMKSMFLKQDMVNTETGETMTRTRGTHELNKPESWEFSERCVRWAAENLGIVLLMPGEQAELEINT